MLKLKGAFSGFSVKNQTEARKFYEEVLGLELQKYPFGTRIQLPGGGETFFYMKGAAHKPASYTMFNLVVDDIDEAVDELTKRGVVFEHYGPSMYQDEKGIMRGRATGKGPDQAWFKDPSGNIVSVLVEGGEG